MGPSDLPHLTLAAVHPEGLACRFDPSRWIGEGWIGCIYLGNGRFLWGRFRQVDAVAINCIFSPDSDAESLSLCPGESYPYLDGYWGQRAELVLAEDRSWERRRFQPSDAVRYPVEGGNWLAPQATEASPPGGEVVPDGWEHEHCNICWEKIAEYAQLEGYFSEPNKWVCKQCFSNFVAPRSIAFVNW